MNKNFREKLLKLLLPVGGISTLANVPILYNLNFAFAALIFVIGVAYISTYFFFKNQKISYNFASNITLLLLFIETLCVPIADGNNMIFLPWVLMYPIVTFSLKPSRHSLILSMFLLAVFTVMFLFTFQNTQYNMTQVVTFGMFYLTAVIVFYYWSKSYEEKETLLNHQNRQLEVLNRTLETKVEEVTKNLEEQNLKFQQQVHLAQMGEMISMIAHQWRQPLSAISSCIAAIELKKVTGRINLETKKQQDDFIEFISQRHEEISEYVQTLSYTIDDFRNFFKPDKLKEEVSLTTPIRRALKIMSSSFKSSDIEFATEFKTDEKLYMYQNEMMQVILNILKNAEDNFIEKDIKNPKVNISTYLINDIYTIEISDNGGGVPQEIVSNIFDPYFSTKSEKNGTGLGLYMSKIMVEEHHSGTLSLLNTEGVQEESIGACFKIELKGALKL
ncbi:MAG: HAMP domain-containing sensor histidine kinase [Campylobacterota bacterium]|nr:HAMP domain-containing sensor histidine kinase [Campylobacterota bacterium]